MLDERLNTIFYYMRTKRFAINKMVKFLAPLDESQLEEMQVLYSIYFNSFVSLIEYIKCDLDKTEILDKCYYVLGSEDNYLYVKELRNSIIHRGLDVSSTGCTLKNSTIVVPFSPPVVSNRTNAKQYNSFTNNLFQLVAMLEQINSYIYKICEDLQILEYRPITEEIYNKRIDEDLYMPDYAKDLSKQIVLDYDEMNNNLKEIHENRINKYFNTNDLFQILKGAKA